MSFALIHLVALRSALEIISPPELACQVDSPVFNMFMGSQVGLVPGDKELVLFPFGTSCRDGSPRFTNDTFALLDVPDSDLDRETVAEIECLVDIGVSGVVILAQHFPTPGFLYFDSRFRGGHLEIPVLHAASSRNMRKVADALSSNPLERVIIKPLVDLNPWRVELWDTTEHFVVYKILLTSMNVLVIMVAIESLVGHVRMVREPSGRVPSKRANWYAILGCSTEVVVSMVRFVYFAIGPFFSSPHFSHTANVFIILAGFSAGMLSTYVAAALFVHWGQFALRNPVFKKAEPAMLAIGFSTFIGGFLQAILEVHTGTTIEVLLQEMIVGAVAVFVSSVTFLFAGQYSSEGFGTKSLAKFQLANQQHFRRRLFG